MHGAIAEAGMTVDELFTLCVLCGMFFWFFAPWRLCASMFFQARLLNLRRWHAGEHPLPFFQGGIFQAAVRHVPAIGNDLDPVRVPDGIFCYQAPAAFAGVSSFLF